MADYTLRNVKGSELTFTEADNNFINSRTTGRATGNGVIDPPSGFYIDQAVTAATQTTATSGGTNRLQITPFIVGHEFTIDQIACWQTSAGSIDISFVIYSTGTDGLPSSKLLETTPLTSAQYDNTVSTSFTFSAHTQYWVGLVTNGNETFRALQGAALRALPYDALNTTSQLNSLVLTTYAPGSAPSLWPTFSSTQMAAGNMIKVNFRAA